MKLHDTQITNYLTFCKSQKCLDVKTIRAYKIDLTHFASTMPAETSLYDIQQLHHHSPDICVYLIQKLMPKFLYAHIKYHFL